MNLLSKEKSPWKILAEKEVYDNPWISLKEYDVINPSGGKGIYGKVHFKNLAIGILPIDKEGNIWLVGQYRFPINIYSWELPEGGGPHDHDPLDSAKRELLEETGLKAESWEKLLEMHVSNSVTDEKAIVYVARDLSQHNAEPEETEDLRVQKIPFETVFQKIMAGEITDSITMAAVLKWKVMQDDL